MLQKLLVCSTDYFVKRPKKKRKKRPKSKYTHTSGHWGQHTAVAVHFMLKCNCQAMFVVLAQLFINIYADQWCIMGNSIVLF